MNNASRATTAPSLNRLAFSATVHCLTGCSIGEVLGMVVGTALKLGNAGTRSYTGTMPMPTDRIRPGTDRTARFRSTRP